MEFFNKFKKSESKKCSKKNFPPGTNERIVTDEVIGNYYSTQTAKFEETTCFIIHYSKDGVHIVPARPSWYG